MEGRTRRFKNGDYRAYKWFTETQWAGLSERDKAMWTEYSEDEPAPIPEEVIDFMEKNDLKTKEPCCKEVDECKKLKAEVKELEAKIKRLTKPPVIQERELLEQVVENTLDEDAAKQVIKEELRKLGVKFSHNAGLENLRKKLKDANDTK